MIAELEEARALGELVKQGWRPRRTIVYIAWDAEEPALLGSTEWAEHHAAELRQKAVLYLNTDGNGRGYLGAGGSHSLERLLNQVARVVDDPESRRDSLAPRRRRHGSGSARRCSVERRASAPTFASMPSARGRTSRRSCSTLGIATLNIGFGGEDGGGIYHSIYDTFSWFTRFSDTSFVYGRALAQVAGTIVMRVANADILPHEFGALAETSRGYVTELKALREEVAGRIAEVNRQLDEGVLAATADPKRPERLPAREAPAPYLNFAPLDNAAESLASRRGAVRARAGVGVRRPDGPRRRLRR